jgi:hypothetical protein
MVIIIVKINEIESRETTEKSNAYGVSGIVYP